jgi:hypothetical protein
MVGVLRGITMRRMRAACLLAFVCAGCMTGPQFDNPMKLPGVAVSPEHGEIPGVVDPDYVPGDVYAELFDQALDAVDDYFPIVYANRYDGRIVAKTITAPGLERFWKAGSPDLYQRTLVTFQEYRYRCEVRIREAHPSGYFVEVVVDKDLNDQLRPQTLAIVIPAFGEPGTPDRDQFLVVEPDITSPIENPSSRWIPKGRETGIEQAILRKLQRCP